MNRSEQLSRLRKWMGKQQLAAFVLPMADPFLSEYVPPHEMRLHWLTGFDGSAGTLVVTGDKAVLFTDGRYIIQAHEQLDTSLYQVVNIAQTSVMGWLQEYVTGSVGYDPILHSVAWVSKTEGSGIQLQAIDTNPIDDWWQDRPVTPVESAWEYPTEYAGKTSKEKRVEIVAELRKQQADALLIATAESIAWLLNIRGGDLTCTPVIQGYALLNTDGAVQLFTMPEKISAELKTKLEPIEVLPIDALGDAMSVLTRKTLLVNEQATPYFLVQQAEQAGAIVKVANDPIEYAKAVKNDVELEHIRKVHAKDGAALVKSFVQLEKWLQTGEAVDELKVDALLGNNRAAMDGFISLSFPAIVGAGEHGAIVHYRVTEESNHIAKEGELLLIDSGGQYLGGTTDVTRTLVIGTPSEEQKRHYTLVLKGHIALARAVFPEGTTGSQLDAIARQYLWAEGLDYDHGTGHGVGACLGVHEGPQRISKRSDTVALKPGMVLSNEPGYYAAGKYGIRIENLIEVVEKQSGFLGFENLTLVPYARELIKLDMLNATEIDWVNVYHQTVAEQLTPHLNNEEQGWLAKACQPL